MTAALTPSSTTMMAVNNRIVATVSICGFREPKLERAKSGMRAAIRRTTRLVCGLTGEVRAWVISDMSNSTLLPRAALESTRETAAELTDSNLNSRTSGDRGVKMRDEKWIALVN